MHTPPPPSRLHTALRLLVVVFALGALAACAGQQPQVNNRAEAQHYAAAARPHYAPPGPPDDPWGPYIIEAANRYDVPQRWIRGVMRRESNGQEFRGDGTLTISSKGAMGLMQVMPQTYDTLRLRYGFGDDPYDPHNNILAGAAFMRELYDLYGMPAFLAAYNAGPRRLDRYLANTAPLPDETRRYVAAIAPQIEGALPNQPSAAEMLAFDHVPEVIPAGLRYPRVFAITWRHGRRHAVLLAARRGRTPVRLAAATRAEPAFTYVAARHRHGWRLIATAMADPAPLRRDAPRYGDWAIQVGAFGNQSQAKAAVAVARAVAGGHGAIGSVRGIRHIIYRARLVGLSREAALNACTRLHRAGCLVLSPDTQS